MKKIINHLASDWYKYLLELIVITAGVLGAFALNNWNEDRKAQIIEKDMLEQFKEGLMRDTADLASNIRTHNRTLTAQRNILSWLSSESPYDSTLGSHFAWSIHTTVFISSDEAFETLKSSGIGSIKTDSIRLAILKLYETTYDYHDDLERIFNAWSTNMLQNVTPTLFSGSYVDSQSNDLIGSLDPLDVNELRSNTAYAYHLKNLYGFNVVFTQKMIEAKEEATQLIQLINRELE